jgi:hypothetical protein
MTIVRHAILNQGIEYDLALTLCKHLSTNTISFPHQIIIYISTRRHAQRYDDYFEATLGTCSIVATQGLKVPPTHGVTESRKSNLMYSTSCINPATLFETFPSSTMRSPRCDQVQGAMEDWEIGGRCFKGKDNEGHAICNSYLVFSEKSKDGKVNHFLQRRLPTVKHGRSANPEPAFVRAHPSKRSLGTA